MKFLEPKFSPAPFDAAAAEVFLKKLDDDKFEVRNKAFEALAEMGAELVPLLEKHENDPSLEVRERVKELLDGQRGTATTNPRLMRELRSIKALERMNVPEAQALLERLAKSKASPQAVNAAKQALGRKSGEE